MAWKVNINQLNNWDLDIKNPTKTEEVIEYTSAELIAKLEDSFTRCAELLKDLKGGL